jgi:transcriptional regulator with XRE-family HTH domain
MPHHPFSVLLERKFLEWQIEMGGRRSQAEFAQHLGVKRASLTMWMNGDHLPERANAEQLAKILGNEVYDALDLPRPNPYLQKINQVFEKLSPEHQQKLAEDAERYEANNEHARKSSKVRKTGTD